MAAGKIPIPSARNANAGPKAPRFAYLELRGADQGARNENRRAPSAGALPLSLSMFSFACKQRGDWLDRIEDDRGGCPILADSQYFPASPQSARGPRTCSARISRSVRCGRVLCVGKLARRHSGRERNVGAFPAPFETFGREEIARCD
jgi:hypothetical protein